MDQFFNNIFGGHDPGAFFSQQAAQYTQQAEAFARQAFDPQNGEGNKGPPPASSNALRQLPTVKVAPEDLVDENNRECCICLEENHLKERVVRLPCAHIFHQKCIHDWLTKHCTCPVCRYELETDDKQYERGRKQRMKSRKPRIHSYELDRMPVNDLRELGKQLKVHLPRMGEKPDLIQALAKSGKVDIIAAPKPVEYILSDLRSMGVGKLRRTMEDAGVFFDPIDVVEKEDMVQIFCNSGRLVLIPEEPNTRPPVAREYERSNNGTIGDTRDGIVVHEHASVGVDAGNSNSTSELSAMSESHPADEQSNTSEMAVDGSDDGNEVPIVSNSNVPTVETVFDEDDSRVLQPAESATEMFGDYSNPFPFSAGTQRIADEMQTSNFDSEQMETEALHRSPEEDVGTDEEDETSTEQAYERLGGCSISELRTTARRLGVDLSGCLERGEMIETLVEAGGGRPMCLADFNHWSVSEIRAIATAINVDLSDCGDRRGMIKKVVAEAKSRPHVSSYLDSLMPLAKLTVPQLRAVARERRVNVGDCLEKGEMILRLVSKGGPRS